MKKKNRRKRKEKWAGKLNQLPVSVVFLSSAWKNVGVTMTCNECDVVNIIWRKQSFLFHFLPNVFKLCFDHKLLLLLRKISFFFFLFLFLLFFWLSPLPPTHDDFTKCWAMPSQRHNCWWPYEKSIVSSLHFCHRETKDQIIPMNITVFYVSQAMLLKTVSKIPNTIEWLTHNMQAEQQNRM